MTTAMACTTSVSVTMMSAEITRTRSSLLDEQLRAICQALVSHSSQYYDGLMETLNKSALDLAQDESLVTPTAANAGRSASKPDGGGVGSTTLRSLSPPPPPSSRIAHPSLARRRRPRYWQLGIMLYECLCGERPWCRCTEDAIDFVQHCRSASVPPEIADEPLPDELQVTLCVCGLGGRPHTQTRLP